MTSAKRLVGAGGLYTLATIAPILTLLLVTPLVTRALGAERYGSVAVAITIYQLTAAFLTLGLATSITRHAILLKGGSRAAAGLVIYGSATVTLLTLLLAATAPEWGPVFFPGVDVTVLVAGGVAGAGLGIVNLSQAILRADERVVAYLITSMAAAFVPPVMGFIAISIPPFQLSATGYTYGLALGYVIIALATLIMTWRRTPPILSLAAFGRGLLVGLPTLPHAVAVPLMTTAAVALATSTAGVTPAGQLQTVAMLGTSVITVMNAVNNAWAPMVMKTPGQDRVSFLKSTTFVIAMIALGLIAGFVLIAPYAVPLIGGPLVTDVTPVHAAMIVAASGAFHAAYLANIHMTFISGRTWPLAISTPAAAGASLLLMWAAGSLADGESSLLLYAMIWPIFYAIQAVLSYLLAVWGPLEAITLGAAAVPLVLALVIVAQGVLVDAQPWSTLVSSALAAALCALLVKRTARRARFVA